MTKRWLDQHDMTYETSDITDEQTLEYFKSLGFMEAPVVVVTRSNEDDEERWSGFQPERLKQLL